MAAVTKISGRTEQEVWRTIQADLLKEDVFYYHALIQHGKKEIELLIDIDLGGGFESGLALTRLGIILRRADGFKFAVHDKDFIDEIGKFLGMQDVKVGYKALDNHLIIKTNDKDKAHHIFADATIRKVFTSLEKFHCGIHTDSGKETSLLELSIDAGINKPAALKKIYHAFYRLATLLEQPSVVHRH